MAFGTTADSELQCSRCVRFPRGELTASSTTTDPATMCSVTEANASRPQTPGMVDTPAVWLAAELESSTAWRHTFDADEIAEIDDAITAARAHSPELDLARLGAEWFPLPGLTALVERIRAQLVEGAGVMLVDGFPVDRYDLAELRTLWWCLGNHLGTPVAQSWRGDVIGDVRDLGTGIDGAACRGYTSNAELGFHSDTADVTALFVLRQARSGGITRLASSVAVHNEIIRRRPEVMELLYEPMPVSWQSNQPEGEQAWYLQPVFGRHGDDVACAYVRTNIVRAAENVGAPPLRPEQLAAVEYVQQVAAEPQFWIERQLAPGSMLFVSNHTAFHMRTAFADHHEPALKRYLLRLWLCLPNGKRLPDTFATFFGDVAAGALRGGYRSRDGRQRFETAPASAGC